MARTEAGRLLTAQHRRAQLGIRAAALRDFLAFWPLWDGTDNGFANLAAATVPLVQAHHRLSATVAGAYYESFRAAEGAGSRPVSLERPTTPDEDVIAGTLYVTGRDMTRRAMLAGQSQQEAMRAALVRTSGTVGRLALAGGRDTILHTTAADRQALGWARVTSGGCAFCAMLASRGPVYKQQTVNFRAHDHCACTAEPVYEGADWPGDARRYQALWQEHAKGTGDPLNAFRRVLEGRVT